MITNMDEARKITAGMFSKYWNGDNPIFDTWNVMECPSGRDEEGKIKSDWTVKTLLDKGYMVKAGYVPTQIRGVKDYYILYKKPYDPKLAKHKRNIKKYGKEVCRIAYGLNRIDGEGANTIGHYTGYTTNQVDAQINAYAALYGRN